MTTPHVLRRVAGLGWLPWALLLAATSAVLVAYGVAPRDVVVFGVYVLIGVAVPGMLWVRLLRNRSGELAEDLALGLVFGYCIEIAIHVLAGLANTPLGLLFPAVTLGLFALHPPLRRFWHSAAPTPAWGSWSVTAMLAVVLAYSARNVFASHPLAGNVTAYVDMHYHLALIGELRHHVPPTIPYVVDTPLAYHWFFYAEAAATSLATGIEPVVLLYRLSGIPMFAAILVLTAAGARRVTKRWAAPLAVAIALFATASSPYSWTSDPVFDAQTLGATWISPTNLLGLALITALIVVLVDVLRASSSGMRTWILVAVLACGAGGAKSTVLPLLVGGLVVMLLLQAFIRHRAHRAGMIAAGIVGTGFVLSMILVYGGTTGGVELGPESLRWFGVAAPALGLTHLSVFAPMAALVVALVLWSFMWAGAFGLAARGRRVLADPAIGLLLGICLGALGAVTMLTFPGLSQLYFLRAAAPAFGILTAAGIAAVIPAGFRASVLGWCVAIAVIGGAVTVLSIAALAPALPDRASLSLDGYSLSVLLPVALLVLCAIIVLATLRFGASRWEPVSRLAPLLIVSYVMGFGAPSTVAVLAVQAVYSESNIAEVPADGVEAARWLRGHSHASDLVATNVHCIAHRGGRCDARHFWVAAFAERRVLVEGWAYTQRAIDISVATESNPRYVPFWDQDLLAMNDGAIAAPTSENLSALVDRYGVRWLLVARAGADLDSLNRLARLRHEVGGFAIYELIPTSAWTVGG